MSRTDRLALAICFAVFLASLGVSHRVYGSIPHIEDEMAFVWQAKAIAQGQLYIHSPEPNPRSFLVPFVVDYKGKRFGKYPIGWPVVLAFGEMFQIRAWINPFITALGLWFLYRTIKKIVDEKTALLAIALGLTSPFLLVNSGSLLSHPWSLFLTIVFFMAWIDAFSEKNTLPARVSPWLPTVIAAFSLGLLVLTRPWTAVAVSIPFALHGLTILFKGPEARWRLVGFGVISAGISSLYFIWQFALTGSILTNPYTLWWPYDRIGFGPGIGLQPDGFQPADALANTLASLYTANTDLFGWPIVSWLFLPFGLIPVWNNGRARLLNLSLAALIAAYAMYWTHTQLFGPRYYFEGLPAVLMLTASGIRWLSGRSVGSFAAQPWGRAARARFAITAFLAIALVSANLVFYLPARLRGMSSVSGISEKCIAPLRNFAALVHHPVLIFVHVQTNIHEYTCSLVLNEIDQQGQIQTAISRGADIDRAVASEFPFRQVYHYYPDSSQISMSARNQPDPELEIP